MIKLPSVSTMKENAQRLATRVVQWSADLAPAAEPGSARASINRNLIAGLVIVLLLGVGVGGWAATTDIAGALIAPGSIVVDSNVKKVQHPTGGIVGELLAHDGDHVKAGQVLVRLDETVTRANLAIVTKGLDELLARKARLQAERDGKPSVTFPPELANSDSGDAKEAMDSERKLFQLRSTARLGEKAQLQQRIDQLEQEIAGIEAQQKAKDQEISLIDNELVGVRKLYAQNLVQLPRLNQLERDAAKLNGERAQLIAAEAQSKGKIAEIRLQIIQIDQNLSSEVAKELRDVDSKIGEFVERKITAEDQLRRTDIRAPQDGTVFQSTVHTVGGVITAGEPIMLIVPDAAKLQVEAKVRPQDIDNVQIGQPVMLRFSAFNLRTTPEIKGTVVRISADTTTDQRTEQSYYTIRVALPADADKQLGDVKLLPGMPVEAFLQTGERTVISYLMKPLRDQFSRAFREK
jgi:membrane fusion protein, type I secretion system